MAVIQRFFRAEADWECDMNCGNRMGRHTKRTMGKICYVLTVGVCCQEFGQTDVDGQGGEILDEMEDNQVNDGNVNVGSTMASIFATKAREKKAKDFAVRFGERLVGWKVRSSTTAQIRKRADTQSLL